MKIKTFLINKVEQENPFIFINYLIEYKKVTLMILPKKSKKKVN